MDELLRRELMARRDEDQRVRSLDSPPKGQYTARLSDDQAAEWDHVDTGNTQFTMTGGKFEPHPIEDPARLDERRTAAGLEPFAAYEARIRGLDTDEA